MNKSALKVVFDNAKEENAKYIGVRVEIEGNKEPEIIINSKENFDSKLDYYIGAYDDDLILISEKGKKKIRITGIAQGDTFEDIKYQLIPWNKLMEDAFDKSCDKILAEMPPEADEERLRCVAIKDVIKGMFINAHVSTSKAKFVFDNVEKYEELFNICMNGNVLEFKKGLIELQRMQNEYISKH